MPTTIVKPLYAVSIPVSCNVSSLATSATFVAGRESNIIDNTSSLFVDFHLNGSIKTGTTPTANTQILVYVYGQLRDTPTLPDVFTGSDAAATLTSAGVGRGFLKLAAVLDVDAATSNRNYPFGPIGITQLVGGTAPPQKFGLFITHNTAVALSGSVSGHFFSVDGLQIQNV
jgi:hypothetical protein